jgi:Pyruvate/2-oxoacid:ferredoxin oxidoreductase delta subunit
MPAIAREIEQAMEEGVIFHEHRGVQRLVLRGEQVVGLELVHRKEMREAGSAKRFVSFEGTESLLHVEQVIPAIGQTVDPDGLGMLLGQRDFLAVSDHGRINGQPGLYAGGDARGGGSVSGAIGDGRRAALAIERDLQRYPEPDELSLAPVDAAMLNLNYFEPQPREHAPILPVAERSGEAEVISGLAKQQVAREALRCLSCGDCLACDNCWTLCPDVAVLKTRRPAEDGSYYVFDYDFCKGCGLCARECPTAYIVMEPEP